MRTTLKDENWKIKTTICWGQRDRWLSYDGVEDFCKEFNHKLINVPTVSSISNLCTYFFCLDCHILFSSKGQEVNYLIHDQQAGHHVQEDSGEELAQLIAQVVGSRGCI